MNIEELRKAAENKDGWVNYLHCAESGDCITEWCLPCYAEAALAASPSPLAAAYKAAMDMSKHWVSSQGATIGDCQVWWDRYRELVSAFRAAQALAEGKGADRE